MHHDFKTRSRPVPSLGNFTSVGPSSQVRLGSTPHLQALVEVRHPYCGSSNSTQNLCHVRASLVRSPS